MNINRDNNLSGLRSDIVDALAKLESDSKLNSMTVGKVLQSIRRSRPVDISELNRLTSSMQELSEKLSNFCLVGQTASRDQEVLRSLCFKMMRVRESKIPEAHAKTFEWIFQQYPETYTPTTNFLDWLKTRNETYWIRGKAGSGKSTLMKFLVSHQRTKDALSKWAGSKQLITAQFFFWNAGTELQKSQEGLLQSLLFQVLRQCPTMILNVCERRQEHDPFENGTMPWTVTELLDCFSRLKRQTQSSSRFCFFIDGLDEYHGECTDLIKALQDLASSPTLKICASSRPLYVFRDAFGYPSSWVLKLEDVTRDDIAFYVNDKLQSNQGFRELATTDGDYMSLIQQVVDKAAGVFLWVYLVVRSLLQGPTNADRISDLQNRISLLPADLEEYFRLIFHSVDKVYRGQTARMFQYALAAPPSGPLPLITFSYLDEENEDFAFKAEFSPLSNESIASREEKMCRRLDARTKGLLEPTYLNVLGSSNFCKRPSVDFLHRTVRDFLLTPYMKNELKEYLGTGFSPQMDLCKAFLAQVKLRPWFDPADCLEALMYYTQHIETEMERPFNVIVDEIERAVSQPWAPWPYASNPNGGFIAFLVEHNLTHSVAQRLQKTEARKYIHAVPYFSQFSEGISNVPLLSVALNPEDHGAYHGHLNPEMISLLLSNGSKPNQVVRPTKFYQNTVWSDVMFGITQGFWPTERHHQALLQTLDLLLRKGADPNKQILGGHTASQVIKRNFSAEEAEKLLNNKFLCKFGYKGKYLLKPTWLQQLSERIA